jgi:uncharacterized protein (DUF427 family)
MKNFEDDSLPVTPPWSGVLRLEHSRKRVRALFANVAVADSRRVMLLLERNHLPVYYFPIEDVRMELLSPSQRRTHCPRKGDASYLSIRVGGRAAENAVWRYERPIEGCPDISQYVAFYWNAMDAWYEEDEEVFGHAHDPYHHIDVHHSSRQVRVIVAGAPIAETRRPRLVFETGIPTRYYLPKLDVRMDLLVPSATQTVCAYKGRATHWTARVGDRVIEDVAWSYPYPNPEYAKIQDLICFYPERVDAIEVDGERESP